MNAYFPPDVFCFEQRQLLSETIAAVDSYLQPDSPGLQVVRYHTGHLAVINGLTTAQHVQEAHLFNRQAPPDTETAEMIAIALNEQLIDTTDYTGRWLAGQLGEVMLRSILVDDVEDCGPPDMILPDDQASIEYSQVSTSYAGGLIELGRLTYGKGKLYDSVGAYRIVAYDQQTTRNLHCISIDGTVVEVDTRIQPRDDQAQIFCETYFADRLDDAIALLVGNFYDPADLDSKLSQMLSGLPPGMVMPSDIDYFRGRCVSAWECARQDQKDGAPPDAALISSLRDWLA